MEQIARAAGSRARFLATQGRFDEALEETSKALDLDPTSALMVQGAAQRFYEAHRYTRAVALAEIAKRLDPLYPYTYSTPGFALVAEGETRRALEPFDKLGAITGRSADAEVHRAYALARAGDHGSAAAAIAEAKRIGGLDAADRALLGLAERDDDATIEALRAAVEARAPPAIWLAVDPIYEPLRDRDDFRSLVAAVGLRVPQD